MNISQLQKRVLRIYLGLKINYERFLNFCQNKYLIFTHFRNNIDQSFGANQHRHECVELYEH